VGAASRHPGWRPRTGLPSRDFPVAAFGAVGDGTTDATAAFRSAIEACHRGGGGRVVVPPGIFLTGPSA